MFSDTNPQAWSALIRFVAEKAIDLLATDAQNNVGQSKKTHIKSNNETFKNSHLRPLQHR